MYDVFISYSWDDREVAYRIYDALTKKNIKPFYDEKNIGPEVFTDKIAQGIKESIVFLFIASKNSLTARFAPEELVYAKKNNNRNIVIYRLDDYPFPDGIAFITATLNKLYADSDSIEVLVEHIIQKLAQGKMKNAIPIFTKDYHVDKHFRELHDCFSQLNYYEVIKKEIDNRYWETNWNHHLLLMQTYGKIGDRDNYGFLLKSIQRSEIKYYPEFYDVISQSWDMLKYGYIGDIEKHIEELTKKKESWSAVICSKVNYTHFLLLTGKPQEALNNYKYICANLNAQDRYRYLLKDFDIIRWLGYSQLSNNVIDVICSYLHYKPSSLYTSLLGHLECQDFNNKLCSHNWHFREERTHINCSFRSFNGIGNAVYYFSEYDRNFLGEIFDVLPFGLDESNKILEYRKAFTQYRLSSICGNLYIEEYDPNQDCISCGQIIKLNDKELEILIIYNGDPKAKGKKRKYKAT